MVTQTPPPSLTMPAATTNGLKAADIRQVKPPVALPDAWVWVTWGLIVLGLLVVGWLVWRWWRKRRSEVVPVPVIPPHVRARQRLREALALIGQPEPFCVAVSNALRIYLEERFNLRAPERTTEEFLEELQLSPRLALDQKRTLADFLARCDLVKFARYEPGEPELRELYDVALRLIEQTDPSPVEPESPGTEEPAAAETP